MFVTETVSYTAAFMAGLLSFFSPCILPLIPAYFTFITGFSLEELTKGNDPGVRSKIILSTISYVCGFSFIFILLGASASYLGVFVSKYKQIISIVGGVIIIIFGIHLMGLFRIKLLEFEKRVHFKDKPVHFLGTFFIGMAFGAGWTPCIGPMLSSILIIASSQDTVSEGIILLSIFSAGLSIPFLLISVFINFLLVFIKKTTKFIGYINAGAGALLILMGCFLIGNNFFN